MVRLLPNTTDNQTMLLTPKSGVLPYVVEFYFDRELLDSVTPTLLQIGNALQFTISIELQENTNYNFIIKDDDGDELYRGIAETWEATILGNEFATI